MTHNELKGFRVRGSAHRLRLASQVRPEEPYDRTAVDALLPDNYWIRPDGIIEGEDYAGWTLDGFVLPRLASGLYFYKEIE